MVVVQLEERGSWCLDARHARPIRALSEFRNNVDYVSFTSQVFKSSQEFNLIYKYGAIHIDIDSAMRFHECDRLMNRSFQHISPGLSGFFSKKI